MTILDSTIAGGEALYIYASGGYIVNNTNITSTYWDVKTNVDTGYCDHEYNNVLASGLPFVYLNSATQISDWNDNVSEILLCNADDTVIDNVTIINTDNNGIWIDGDSENVTILNSVFTQCEEAIHCSDTGSFNIYIQNSTINESDNYGVFISYTDNNNVSGNTFLDNDNYPLYVVNIAENISVFNNEFHTDTSIRVGTDCNGSIFWNNLINSTSSPIILSNSPGFYWNITKQVGTRIIGDGTNISGNAWINGSGTGYYYDCVDSDTDGFCDVGYDPIGVDNNCTGSDACDNLPLSDEYIAGITDINVTIWNGSIWKLYDLTNYPGFICTENQSCCEPENQVVGSLQSIFYVCNNGTKAGDLQSKLNDTAILNISLIMDDDFTCGGAIELTASYQTIHSSLSNAACINISIWANYTNPTAGGYRKILFEIT